MNKNSAIISLYLILTIFISGQILPALALTHRNNDLIVIHSNTHEKKKIIRKDNNGKNNGEESDTSPLLSLNNFDFSLSAGMGMMRGHTTYQIGGKYTAPDESGELHFPISKLKFPVDINMMLFETGIQFIEKLKTDITFQKNLTKKTGKMRDYDWGVPFENPVNSGTYYWYGPDHLDIYSESKTEIRALIFDLDILYRLPAFNQRRSSSVEYRFFAGLGYLYQRYEFQCRLIRQWDYREANPDPLDAAGDGSVGLTYDIVTHIPYLKINADILFNKIFTINAGIGYSPYVKSEDEDNHILRSKRSYGKSGGDALLFSVGGKVDIIKSLFIRLQFDYLSLNTEGKQKQYIDGSWSATIDQKNSGKRESVELLAGYKF